VLKDLRTAKGLVRVGVHKARHIRPVDVLPVQTSAALSGPVHLRHPATGSAAVDDGLPSCPGQARMVMGAAAVPLWVRTTVSR